MAGKTVTYSQAGVSITRGDRFIDAIRPHTRMTKRPEVLGGVGGFASLARIPSGYKSPILVTATDGVGTKLLLAKELKKHDTIGVDLVAMSVNDMVTLGAEPFLFLDYFATGKLSIREGSEVVKGVAKGCKEAGCALVGGETAEMPGLYKPGEYDLAGFGVGIVEKTKIVDGSKAKAGDVVIGLPSSGIHSNGYSLVRAILKKKRIPLKSRPALLKGKCLGDVLLQPTKIYVKDILKLQKYVTIKGMAHITGGGIVGNLPRVLPKGLSAQLNPKSWRVPPVFKFLQERGNVPEEDMFRTFNMGIGYILIVSPKDQNKTMRLLPTAKLLGKLIKKPGPSKVIWL